MGTGGRFLGLVRRRGASLGGASTKDLHVAFTVLSEGIDFSKGTSGLPGQPPPRPQPPPRGDGAKGREEASGELRDGGYWGRVACSDLEVERQTE